MPKNSTTAVSYPVCHGASHSALVQGTWRTSSLASKLAGLKAYLGPATGRVCRLPMGLWKTRRKLFVSHQSSVELLMFVVLCNSLSCWFKHSHGAECTWIVTTSWWRNRPLLRVLLGIQEASVPPAQAVLQPAAEARSPGCPWVGDSGVNKRLKKHVERSWKLPVEERPLFRDIHTKIMSSSSFVLLAINALVSWLITSQFRYSTCYIIFSI